MPHRTLTILLDTDDLADVEAACPEALSGSLIAFDTDLHIALKDWGIRHLTPWDFVGPEDSPALQEWEAAIWQFWKTNARPEYHGLNLLDICVERHQVCFSRLTWPAYVIDRAIQTLRPNEVVTFEEPVGHGLDQTTDYRKTPLLFALARGMAEQAGLPVRLLSRQTISARQGFEDLVAANAERKMPPLAPRDLLAGRPYILFPASGPDLVRQLPLIRALHQKGDFRIVQLYKAADERSLQQARDVGHLVWHESQVTHHTPMPEDLPLLRNARQAFDAACQSAPDPVRPIFANPHMRIHFDFIFGEYLRKMVWHVDAWTDFFRRHRPALLVSNYPAPICDVACHRGIPCLGLTHALMMVGHTRWFLNLPPSLVGAISETHRQRLIEAGMPPDRIRVTGDPWADPLIQQAAQQKPPDLSLPPRHRDLRERLGISPDRRTILLGTGSLGMLSKMQYLPIINWAESVRSFEQIGQLAARRPEWCFLLKCHPRFDHPLLYDRTNRALPPDRRILLINDQSLDALAQMSDTIVFVNMLTSGMIETSLWHKPVLLLAQGLVRYRPEAWAVQQWPHVRSVLDLETALHRMFTDRLTYQQYADQTRSALTHYFGGSLTPSIPRCLDEIYRTASAGAG